MSLKVWITGTDGTLKNQGLLQLPSPSYNTTSEVTSGKLGKAVQGQVCYHLSSDPCPSLWSIACWSKFTSGYTANNNIILCLNTSNSNDDKFYLSIVNNTTLNIGRGTSATISYILPGNFLVNTWYHLAATFDGTTTKLYLNGSLVNSSTGGSTKSASNLTIGGRSDNTNGTAIIGAGWATNDVRIYDHCLSETEVKEIAKGLVAHWTLGLASLLEATENKAAYPTPTGTYTCSYATDPITVANWSKNVNTGVTNYTSGTHAYWKLIDGIPTMVFPDTNSSINQPHRWLGINGGGLNYTDFPSGTKYTISFDARADINEKELRCGLHYLKSGDSSYAFNDVIQEISLTTYWKRYSITRTCVGAVSGNVNIYFYGHYGTIETTSYVRNVLLEFKDHATTYTPTSRASGIIYDVSGYSNNLTISHNNISISDSIRYDKAVLFPANVASLLTTPLTIDKNAWTISFWEKCDWTNVETSSPYILLWNKIRIRKNGTTGRLRTLFYYLNSENTLTNVQIYFMGAASDNSWKHFVMTFDGTTLKTYLNGGLYISSTLPSGSTLYDANGNFILNYSAETMVKLLSDVRVYTTALSATDVQQLYSLGN